MARKNYRIDEVLASLNRKNDAKVIGGTVYILADSSPIKKNDLGNGSWGKIDYLTKYQGYSISRVKSFPKPM